MLRETVANSTIQLRTYLRYGSTTTRGTVGGLNPAGKRLEEYSRSWEAERRPSLTRLLAASPAASSVNKGMNLQAPLAMLLHALVSDKPQSPLGETDKKRFKAKDSATHAPHVIVLCYKLFTVSPHSQGKIIMKYSINYHALSIQLIHKMSGDVPLSKSGSSQRRVFAHVSLLVWHGHYLLQNVLNNHSQLFFARSPVYITLFRQVAGSTARKGNLHLNKKRDCKLGQKRSSSGPSCICELSSDVPDWMCFAIIVRPQVTAYPPVL